MLRRQLASFFPHIAILLCTVLLFALSTCADDAPAAPVDPTDTTTVPTDDSITYGAPDTLCMLVDAEIDELSGIAASRVESQVFWIHNDSGDEPRIFAVDSTGRTLAVCTLSNAEHVDWEDMASVMLMDLPWLYVGDIGDNDAKRDSIIIYRLREPVISPAWDRHALDAVAERASFTYEDGARDCEALMVDSRDGSILLVEKTGSKDAVVYRAAWPGDGGSATLTRTARMEIPFSFSLLRNVTGADLSANGRRVVIRCYGGILEAHAPSADSLSTLLDRSDWNALPAAILFQPEAVCYAPDGATIITASEGAHTPLLRFQPE